MGSSFGQPRFNLLQILPVQPLMQGKEDTNRNYNYIRSKPNQDSDRAGYFERQPEEFRKDQDGCDLHTSANSGNLDGASHSDEAAENEGVRDGEVGCTWESLEKT